MNLSLLKHYFKNPNGKNVRKWVPKSMSKFHNDPTVNESKIVILLNQVWVDAKKKLRFSYHRHYFTNLNGGDVRNWVPNLVFKLHDDPTINKFDIVAYYLLYSFFYFIKINSILPFIKRINITFFYFLKINIYFIYLKNIILINKIIHPYLFVW